MAKKIKSQKIKFEEAAAKLGDAKPLDAVLRRIVRPQRKQKSGGVKHPRKFARKRP